MSINLHDIIKKWNTEKLIGFLRNQELNLDDEDFSCLRNLIDCKLKVGPTVTLLNLITEINTGKLSSEKLIPVLKDVKNSKWLYSRYFYAFPFNQWSLEHYENWILNNYTTSKKEVYNQCFFKIIRKIKEDSKTLEEIREFVSKLDRKSNFVCNDFIDDEYTGYEAMLEGNISTFLDMILNYYKAKSLREFRGYNEVAFQTAVELLLPTNIDSSKISGEGRFGFIDIFVNGVNGNGLNSSIILELKCISLVGLLSGEEGRWIDNPGYKSLMALDAKLEKETENELLKRIYFYWCKEKKKCERVN
ncbi:9892_t:CDS:2, partial [Entrophospora sp. SA101]